MSNGMERKQHTIEIIGMTCKGCARTLENEFRKFENIDYSVNFPAKNIVVSYFPAEHKKEEFEKAIESHGYKVKRK